MERTIIAAKSFLINIPHNCNDKLGKYLLVNEDDLKEEKYGIDNHSTTNY